MNLWPNLTGGEVIDAHVGVALLCVTGLVLLFAAGAGAAAAGTLGDPAGQIVPLLGAGWLSCRRWACSPPPCW